MHLRREYSLNSKFLLLLAMLYISLNLSSAAVAFRFYNLGPFIISASGLIYPLTFFITDSIAEVYGYSIARKVIWMGLFCELVFAVIIEILIRLPFGSTVGNGDAFLIVFGPLLQFVLSCIVGDLFGIFLNVYCLSKWKVMLKGKLFGVRSIFSTCFGELSMTFICIFLGFSGYNNLATNFKVAITTYLFLVAYAMILVWPTWFFTSILKRVEKLDVYDINTNFNPFRL